MRLFIPAGIPRFPGSPPSCSRVRWDYLVLSTSYDKWHQQWFLWAINAAVIASYVPIWYRCGSTRQPHIHFKSNEEFSSLCSGIRVWQYTSEMLEVSCFLLQNILLSLILQKLNRWPASLIRVVADAQTSLCYGFQSTEIPAGTQRRQAIAVANPCV